MDVTRRHFDSDGDFGRRLAWRHDEVVDDDDEAVAAVVMDRSRSALECALGHGFSRECIERKDCVQSERLDMTHVMSGELCFSNKAVTEATFMLLASPATTRSQRGVADTPYPV